MTPIPLNANSSIQLVPSSLVMNSVLHSFNNSTFRTLEDHQITSYPVKMNFI